MSTGVLQPGEALEGFGSPALCFTVLGLFADLSGLFRSGGLGSAPRAESASDAVRTQAHDFCCLPPLWVAPVSAFVPNTPIVASLLR